MSWLNKDIINLTYVCQLLYGKSDKSTRAKLYNKIKGHQNKRFSEEELIKLEAIKNKILSELQ